MDALYRVARTIRIPVIRLLLVVFLFVVGVGLAPAAQAAPGSQRAASSGASDLVDLVNGERAANGLPPLQWRDDVAAIARDWSEQMAASGQLSHNDAYFSSSTKAQIGSRANGENVAYATSVTAAHNALMNSAPHRANILDPRFTDGGFGAVQDANGVWWVTEDFMQSTGAPPPEPEPVAEEPSPEPEPVADEQPAPEPPTTGAAPSEPATTAPSSVPRASAPDPATAAAVPDVHAAAAGPAAVADAPVPAGSRGAIPAQPLGAAAAAVALLVANAVGIHAVRRR